MFFSVEKCSILPETRLMVGDEYEARFCGIKMEFSKNISGKTAMVMVKKWWSYMNLKYKVRFLVGTATPAFLW